MKKYIVLILAVAFLVLPAFSQAKKKTPKKPTVTTKPTQPTPTPTPEAVAPETTPTPVKKNGRPDAESTTQQQTPVKKNQNSRPDTDSAKTTKIKYPYVYEFTQPNFVVSHIVIEHDDKGKGTITFQKKDFGEPMTDPIQLSTYTLDKIKGLFTALNFLDSVENYQSERDYAHLGNYQLTLRKDSKERSAKYNWTENKDAKALAEEYRKISEQYIWYFDAIIARQNQPLEAPTIVERLASLLRRGEISDPPQMLPFLREMANDERIPLIARNHASRLIKDIEKNAKKAEK